jgi:RNA polymerase sigma-70 factor, ECF subfamily
VKEIALQAVVAAEPRSGAADAARFERLWDAHYTAVHAHAARRVGADADEVCAEVFLVAWRRLDEVPRDELPWLLATSRNVIGTLWRGETRRSRLQERLDGDTPAATGDQLGHDPELFAALARLEEIDRELLLLVYWEGLSASRAARAVGLAPTAARTRLWRARRRLRHALTDREDRP